MSSTVITATMNTAGRLNTPPSDGRLGDGVGQDDAEGSVEELVDVASPTDGDGGHRHAVLQIRSQPMMKAMSSPMVA